MLKDEKVLKIVEKHNLVANINATQNMHIHTQKFIYDRVLIVSRYMIKRYAILLLQIRVKLLCVANLHFTYLMPRDPGPPRFIPLFRTC